MSQSLIDLIANLPQTRLLLVGDLMLDRYIFGNAERLSPEAPVPVLHFQHEEYRLGGAGSVLADLAALGAAVSIVAVLGRDEASKEVRKHLANAGADVRGLMEVDGRPTVTKLRLVGSAQHRNPQQMIRLDIEDTGPIDAATGETILSHIREGLASAEILCLED